MGKALGLDPQHGEKERKRRKKEKEGRKRGRDTEKEGGWEGGRQRMFSELHLKR
jgi:hypothetical protein